MRILLVNKFIFPKGGAETYTFDVGKMLEEHGHEVQYFGLENEKNIVGNRVDSYVTNMDFSQGIRLGTFQLSDLFYNTVGGMIGGLMYYGITKAKKHL